MNYSADDRTFNNYKMMLLGVREMSVFKKRFLVIAFTCFCIYVGSTLIISLNVFKGSNLQKVEFLRCKCYFISF